MFMFEMNWKTEHCNSDPCSLNGGRMWFLVMVITNGILVNK